MPNSPRQRLRLASRSALESAASRALQDPAVESCTIDVPNLVVEVALASHVVGRQQAVADWRRRFDSALRKSSR
jgi:hypothetical protein